MRMRTSFRRQLRGLGDIALPGSSPLLRTAAALSFFASSCCACDVPMQRDILLQVARPCVANHAVTGFAFPCLEVNTSDGGGRRYVVLRRPGLRDIVLAPTRPVVGLEDPWLRTAAAPNYFQDAWSARRFLQELRQRQLAHDDVALAVNSGLSRARSRPSCERD
jgi:CDP-diacylglycerol pyrophosphatase